MGDYLIRPITYTGEKSVILQSIVVMKPPIVISFTHHHRVHSADLCCCLTSLLYGKHVKERSMTHGWNKPAVRHYLISIDGDN